MSGVRLVGYDNVTELAAVEHDVPASVLARAKEIAGVPDDDPDVTYCYPLENDEARGLATLIGVEIDTDANAFFLEGFA